MDTFIYYPFMIIGRQPFLLLGQSVRSPVFDAAIPEGIIYMEGDEHTSPHGVHLPRHRPHTSFERF